MMISMIILGCIGLLVLVGLGKNLLKDFHLNAIIFVLILGAVIGLNFIPTINIGRFSFTVGTAVMYVFALVMFFVFGRPKSMFTALAIALILGGLGFAATRLCLLSGNTGFFSTTNWAYALIIGTLAFVLTQNGKYSFVVATEAMMVLNLLVQIGSERVDLSYGFDWTVVATATAIVMYEVFAKIMTKPSKLSYYFETSESLDERGEDSSYMDNLNMK